ncbi:MAG: UbiA family prenyltransferase [FCB group bacterium]
MSENIIQENIKPVCVDLDGTLIASDTLLESIILSLKINPLYIFLFPFWILKGRLYFKNKIGQIAIPKAESLPYRQEVLKYINEEKSKGAKIILVTASVQKIADAVGLHLGIFDEVYGSTNNLNLRSNNKSQFLVDKFGKKGFIYVGDSKPDLKVWESAFEAVVVEPSKSLLTKVNNINKNISTIQNSEFRIQNFKLIIKEIRVYQWIKNILIFIPLLLAHRLHEYNLFLNVSLAFLSFSFTSSAVYILNDMLDLEADRIHPRKKFRPFASGNLSLINGIILFPLLLATGLSISFLWLPKDYLLILLLYLFLTTSYSFLLKKIAIFDIIILACLYTIRLIAGAKAVDVVISPWLLGFSIFLFLSLALIKRYQELLTMQQNNKTQSKGRGYFIDDLTLVLNLGTSSGYLSVLVLALYVNSKEVTSLYHHPELLWFAVICHLYWISRMWLIAHRGKMEDDPIIFTAKDYVSYIIGLIIVILALGASLWV